MDEGPCWYDIPGDVFGLLAQCYRDLLYEDCVRAVSLLYADHSTARACAVDVIASLHNCNMLCLPDQIDRAAIALGERGMFAVRLRERLCCVNDVHGRRLGTLVPVLNVWGPAPNCVFENKAMYWRTLQGRGASPIIIALIMDCMAIYVRASGVLFCVVYHTIELAAAVCTDGRGTVSMLVRHPWRRVRSTRADV